MLSVQLFGVPSAKIAGVCARDDLGRSGRLLASYLFNFSGKAFRREHLQELFWGELTEDRARAAMNTALWRIRKLLAADPDSEGGANLIVRNSEIVLQPADWLTVDTEIFSREVGRIAACDDRDLSGLKSCAGLYNGQFLEGEVAEWAVVERERLERLYIQLLSLLANTLTQAGLFEAAIATARQILAVDPFREAVHRDLIVTLTLNEQRGAAIRHFEQLRHLLRQELGVTPMPETASLIESLRSDGFYDRFRTLQHGCFRSSALQA